MTVSCDTQEACSRIAKAQAELVSDVSTFGIVLITVLIAGIRIYQVINSCELTGQVGGSK